MWCGWLFLSWACSRALFSQAHTSLKRKFAGLTIPRLSVFIPKVGQPCGMQNHLTELLDEQARRSYSERTLQPGRTPGRGSQGVRRTLPAEERKAGGPQIRLLFPVESGAPLREGPGAAAGAFSLVRARAGRARAEKELVQPRSQARRAARMAWSSVSSRRPTRLPTMPRIPPASMIHASASASRSAAIAPSF